MNKPITLALVMLALSMHARLAYTRRRVRVPMYTYVLVMPHAHLIGQCSLT